MTPIWKPLKGGSAPISRKKKNKHSSIRWPNHVLEILQRHQKRTGLPLTKVVCDLILWSDALERSGKLPVNQVPFARALEDAK